MDPKRFRDPVRLAAAVIAILLAGCADTSGPPGSTVLSQWEGTLSPVVGGTPDSTLVLVTGEIGATVTESGTEAEIGLQAFEEPDLVMDWGVRQGLCDVPGDLIGTPDSYPPVSASSLDASASLPTQLAEGGAYYVAVTDTVTGDAVACGNLSEVEL